MPNNLWKAIAMYDTQHDLHTNVYMCVFVCAICKQRDEENKEKVDHKEGHVSYSRWGGKQPPSTHPCLMCVCFYFI